MSTYVSFLVLMGGREGGEGGVLAGISLSLISKPVCARGGLVFVEGGVSVILSNILDNFSDFKTSYLLSQ